MNFKGFQLLAYYAIFAKGKSTCHLGFVESVTLKALDHILGRMVKV